MKKILAIDDQADNLITIQAVLKNNISECTLLTALSGKEGIKIAQKELPDVILLDIIMPGMDGYEVCKKLKKDELTKHIPIIMVTAIKTDSESRVKGLNIGADAFLSKPIDPIELTAQVNVMLRIKEAEDILRLEKEDLEILVEERTIELSGKNKKLQFEIRKREKAEKALRDIATEFSAISGREFFEKVCLHLTKTLHLDYAFIGELLPKEHKIIVRTGASKGMPLEEFEYNLVDTPCENVVGQDICAYPSNVQQLFPKDHLLVEMGIEGYIGIPLFSRAREALGIMVLLDSKELIDPEIPTSVLQIFSDRVATEMERMNAKEALQESETRFKNLVGLLPEIIFETDLNFNLTYVNKRAFELFKYTEKDFSDGLNGMNILAPEDHERAKENFTKRLKGGDPGTVEYNAMRKDGSAFPVLFHASSIFKDGKLSGIRGIMVDLSDLKLAEEKIRKLSTAVEQSPSVIAITDLKGQLEYVNPKYSKLTGYTSEETLGKQTNLLKSGDQSDEFYKELWNMISSGKEWRGEFHNKKKNGELFWEAASISPIVDKHGNITNYLKVAEDVTEKKIAEKELKDSEARFKALHNASFGGIAIHDLGIIKECNQGLSNMTGYHIDELIEMDGLLLIAEGSREMVMNNIKASYEKSYEAFGLRKNGEEYPMRIEGKMIPYEEKEVRVVEFRDITEQKISAQALLESEEKYRSLVDNLPVGIFRSTFEGKVISANPAMAKIYGYDTIEELVNIPAQDYYSDENPRDQMINALKKEKVLLGRETIENTKDGSKIWVYANYQAIFNKKGEITHIDGVIIDITERKIAQQALQNSEENYRELIEGTRNLITRVDKQGNFTFINQISHEIFGLRPEECIGLNAFEFVYDDDKQRTMEWFEEMIKLKETNGTIENRQVNKKTAKVHNLLWTCNLQFSNDGDISGMSAIAKDITEFKIAEQTLKESEERFTLSMRASKDGLFDWDLITNEIFYSENWKKMLGYEDHELSNHISTWQKLTQEEGKVRSLKKMDWAIKNNIPRYEEEFKMKHKQGHWVDIMSRAEFVYNEKKDAIRVVGTHVDITKQRQYERNLKDALHKATESDRLKSAFLATMSHELRTPLNAIIGFSEIIKDDYSIEEIKNFNNHIHTSGNHLLTIVEDLFDLTLIEAGQMTLRTTDEEIPKLLNNVFEIIKSEQQSLEKGHLELKLLIPDNCQNLNMFTDAFKLKQILINLLKNALKFTHKGTVEFGCKIVEEQKNKLVQFYVKDTGIGIPNDKHQLIFDAFRQVEESHTRVYGGTGIGLSITKKLVEILDGKIILESVVDKGSTFYFSLPLILTDSYKLKKTHKETSFGHYDETKNEDVKQKTILIVEDVESCFDLLKIILKDKKFNILWAKNGKEAIELCKKNNQIDLILMDLNMPVMNGYEATKHIKSLNPKIPIIAQTAFAISGDREKALKVGCDDYISKPIKKDKLLMKINDLLKKF